MIMTLSNFEAFLLLRCTNLSCLDFRICRSVESSLHLILSSRRKRFLQPQQLLRKQKVIDDGTSRCIVVCAGGLLTWNIALSARVVELHQFAPKVSNVNLGVNLSSLEQQIPLELGLVWGYYSKTCSNADSIIYECVAAAIRNYQGIAPGLLRIFFHDCFSQGCDGSFLLSDSRGSELNDPANASIRRSGLNLIDQIKAALEQACRGVVSSADIIVVATRDSIKLAKGPAFNVPLGRLDSFSRFSTNALPTPFASFSDQLSRFRNFGLTTQDLVALASGAHMLGVAQCGSFQQQLRPTVCRKCPN